MRGFWEDVDGEGEVRRARRLCVRYSEVREGESLSILFMDSN